MLKLLALITLGGKLFEPGPLRNARKSLHLGSRVQRFFSPQAPGHWKWKLPSALVTFRIVLGPVLVLICLQPRSGLLLAGGLVLPLISDIFHFFLAPPCPFHIAPLPTPHTLPDT